MVRRPVWWSEGNHDDDVVKVPGSQTKAEDTVSAIDVRFFLPAQACHSDAVQSPWKGVTFRSNPPRVVVS